MTLDQTIRYTTTSDGVKIAYSVTGAGPPVVFVSSIFGSVHMSAQVARHAATASGIAAQGFTAVQYDQRGAGSSDRDCGDYSLEPLVRDLEAVVERAVPDGRCALVATTSGGPVAITFAVRHPQRVSHLVLRNAFADGGERHHAMLGVMISRAIRPLLLEHADFWPFFALTLANSLNGYTDSEAARAEAEGYRTSMSGESYVAMAAELDHMDVRPLLPSVQAPTLVVNDTAYYLTVGSGWAPIARQITAGIPNARLVTTDDFIPALVSFLREGDVADAASALVGLGTAVIMFIDIADSTALTERLGDATFRDASRTLDAGLRAAISECGGTAIAGKVLGDGVLATFTSAAQAIDSARRCRALSVAAELGLHIGLHAGDVIGEDDNVYGGSVNIASRVCELSPPGEVFVSDVVRGMARSSAGVEFEDLGEQSLKGIAEPVRVYAVRWRE